MSAFSASRAGRVALIPRHPHLWFVGFALSQALVAALWWRFGTAIGLMWVAQNAGIGGANLAAGWLNDRAGASAANPAGYDAMMAFFGTASVLGFACALALWLTAGRRRDEVRDAASPGPAAAG